jgi:hypothetical protein
MPLSIAHDHEKEYETILAIMVVQRYNFRQSFINY